MGLSSPKLPPSYNSMSYGIRSLQNDFQNYRPVTHVQPPLFRHASVSSTYPMGSTHVCLSVDNLHHLSADNLHHLVTLWNFHYISVSGCSTWKVEEAGPIFFFNFEWLRLIFEWLNLDLDSGSCFHISKPTQSSLLLPQEAKEDGRNALAAWGRLACCLFFPPTHPLVWLWFTQPYNLIL